MTDPDPDNRPLQYSLRSLLWFTTVVAVVCASYACATRLWGDSGGMTWLAIMFIFWPSFAAFAVWTFPGIPFDGRLRTFVVIGVGVTLLFWCRMLLTGDIAAAVFFASVSTFVTAFLLWAPQILVVFAATTYARERNRIRQSQGLLPNPSPHPQSLPPAGSTSRPRVE